MKRRGVEQISYFQVDNPLVRIIDPVFLGLHVGAGGGENASSGEMSSKMIPKAYAEEKLGVFCLADGKLDVIEYSDMPAALSKETNAEGALRFNAGSIAIHCISVEFVERLNNDPKFSLPYHRAEKKIPAIDPQTGAPVTPEKNNGVKLERFVFDALPRARASIVLETVREEEFAPIKNATGVDSVVSSKDLQVRRAARWLTSAGAQVPMKDGGAPDCVLELSPLTALEPEDLKGKVEGLRIERGMEVAV